MNEYVEYETTGRFGKPLKVRYLTYEAFCRKVDMEDNPTTRQVWVEYTRQCADGVRFNELFREVGEM